MSHETEQGPVWPVWIVSVGNFPRGIGEREKTMTKAKDEDGES